MRFSHGILIGSLSLVHSAIAVFLQRKNLSNKPDSLKQRRWLVFVSSLYDLGFAVGLFYCYAADVRSWRERRWFLVVAGAYMASGILGLRLLPHGFSSTLRLALVFWTCGIWLAKFFFECLWLDCWLAFALLAGWMLGIRSWHDLQRPPTIRSLSPGVEDHAKERSCRSRGVSRSSGARVCSAVAATGFAAIVRLPTYNDPENLLPSRQHWGGFLPLIHTSYESLPEDQNQPLQVVQAQQEGIIPRRVLRIAFDEAEKQRFSQVFRHDIYQWSNRSANCVFGEASQTVRTLFPDAEECFRRHFDGQLLAHFRDTRIGRAVQLDLARICFLYDEGGVYADADYEFLRNFLPELEGAEAAKGNGGGVGGASRFPVFLVESQWTTDIVQNSLMLSPRKHPFWRAVACESAKRLSRPFYVDMWVPEISGPGPLSAVFARSTMDADSSSSSLRTVRTTFWKTFLCWTGHCGACLSANSVRMLPCRLYQPYRRERQAWGKEHCLPSLVDRSRNRRSGSSGRSSRSGLSGEEFQEDESFGDVRAVHWSTTHWASAESNDVPSERFGLPLEYACRRKKKSTSV